MLSHRTKGTGERCGKQGADSRADDEGSTAGLAPVWASGPDRCSLPGRAGAAVKHAPETIPVPSPAPKREQPRRYMEAGGTLAPVDEGLAASAFDYERFTSLSGPLTRPAADEPYRVQYRGIHHSRRERVAIRLIAVVLAAVDVRFIYWLVIQSHRPHLGVWLWSWTVHAAATDAYILLLVGLALGSIVMQLFLLMNVLTVSRACLVARDPIPVEPDPTLRVAFLTTIVPGKEPIEMAERTLAAAREIVYDGTFDVWLLDEGDSGDVQAMCDRLGVHHFTRKGRGYLEFDTGIFASQTKHGNHNRWLWEHGGEYDVVMFADTDHVPLPIMAERLLGYFRDPEVAFVVGPQFYGNQGHRITRWAESAQYLFHSVIQRAGNRRGCAMLVGTNAAIGPARSGKGTSTRSPKTWPPACAFTPARTRRPAGPGGRSTRRTWSRWAKGPLPGPSSSASRPAGRRARSTPSSVRSGGWASSSGRARCCTTS